MNKYKIGIQNNELGERGGIGTYSQRLCDSLNKIKKDKYDEDVEVEAYQFVSKPQKNTDIINIQYEPGLLPPQNLQMLINNNLQPIAITVHHTGYLPQSWSIADGYHFHSTNQYEDYEEQPWTKKIIPHPSLVFPKKDRDELRKKFGLPEDKKIIGTFGFIAGTGKNLPDTVHSLLTKMNKDEFLYLGTAFWKGGDMGRKNHIEQVVRDLGMEENFRLDTDFVSAEELNEKMQACDLLFSWCAVGPNAKGSQSGIAADMYGSRTKLIVKNSAHYSFMGNQDKVIIGSEKVDSFTSDVLNTLRNEDLDDVQNPEWLSWDNQAVNYLDFFQELLGE